MVETQAEYPEINALIDLFRKQLYAVHDFRTDDRNSMIMACQRMGKLLDKAKRVAEQLEYIIYRYPDQLEEVLRENKESYGFVWVEGLYHNFYDYKRPSHTAKDPLNIIANEVLNSILTMLNILEFANLPEDVI